MTTNDPARQSVSAIAQALNASARDLVWFRAPGRVNLMGEHTDYNDGFVLPMAINLDCVIGARIQDGVVRVTSLDVDEPVEVNADGGDKPSAVFPEWGRYVAGVVSSLADLGRPPVGIDAAVRSTVPIGAGLASSAAIEVATAHALLNVAGMPLSEVEVAVACQRAEQMASGVPCGIMDQLVSVAAEEGSALLIDCQSLQTRPVLMPEGLSIIAVHSGVQRSLSATAYADRRTWCERTAARLGLSSLRAATLKQVANDPIARHVVTENARVLEMVEALEENDTQEMSRLFAEGHASLRDDYKVSTPQLDLLVELLVEAGAIGARLTGAGFGGCVVAIADEQRVEPVIEIAVEAYVAETQLPAAAFVLFPAGGAGPLSPEV
jgi:galactokinase